MAFCLLLKNIGKNIGKSLNKNLSVKYSQKRLEHAKQMQQIHVKPIQKE